MRVLLCALFAAAVARAAPSFSIANDSFMRDGEPFRIMAGCVHYARVPAALWDDRLARLRAMGLNAIEVYTYVGGCGSRPLRAQNVRRNLCAQVLEHARNGRGIVRLYGGQ
jgi:hypothetical protein